MVERARELTIDEFMRLYDEQPFEIINGERKMMSPTKFGHSKISKRIYDALLLYCLSHGLGEVFFETVFILEDKPDWVEGSRTPDVMFVSKERLAAYEAQMQDINDKPLILVPDLVVEVVSPTDRYSDVDEKIDAYLADGVKMLWIVDPQQEKVKVYEIGKAQPDTKRTGDTISGGEVIPGFAIKVSDILRME